MSRVNVFTAKGKIAKSYIGGCTDYVTDVLGKPLKHIMFWARRQQVQIDQLRPGDVVGWGGNGQVGAVAIYDGCKFLFCAGPGKPVKQETYLNDHIYRMEY